MDGFNWLWLCYPCSAAYRIHGGTFGRRRRPDFRYHSSIFGSGMQHPHLVQNRPLTTTILFISFSSMRSYVAQNVEWPAVKGILPGIFLVLRWGRIWYPDPKPPPLRIISIAFTFIPHTTCPLADNKICTHPARLRLDYRRGTAIGSISID